MYLKPEPRITTGKMAHVECGRDQIPLARHGVTADPETGSGLSRPFTGLSPTIVNLRMNQSIRILAVTLSVWIGSVALVCHSVQAAPEAAVVASNRANLRASPSAGAEVVGTLNRGQTVTVLEQIPVRDPQGEEPSSWTKIRLPASVKVWVFAAFVDPKSGMVNSKELKIRSGPGKNYAAIGDLEQGDLVVPIRTLEGWMQIEPPAAAVAYVAANLLQFTGGPTTRPVTPNPSRQPERLPGTKLAPGNSAPADEPPQSQPLNAAVAKPVLPTTATKTPSTTDSPAAPNPVARVETPPGTAAKIPKSATDVVANMPSTPALTNATPVDISTSVQYRQPVLIYDETRPRRVLREGVVGLSISPDAPGWYQLDSFRRGERPLDYLLVEDPKKTDLSKWRGKRVFIEGDEYRVRQWRTPVVKIISIRAAL